MNFVEMIENKQYLKKYLFIRGFVITDNPKLCIEKFPFNQSWVIHKLCEKYYAYVQEKTKFTIYCFKEKVFFLGGSAYNPFTMEISEERILSRIADAYGTEQYQDRIDELTGVFIYGVISSGGIEYLVDPSGMQSAYYGKIGEYFYLSTHSQLIGDVCRLQMSDFVKELIQYKWYYRVMGPYLPGDMSPFEKVKRIVPNIEYAYDGKSITHKRFYPIKDLAQCRTNNEYHKVIVDAADILKKNMILISEKWNNPFISLTGGIDSNTTFAAANGNYKKFEAFSYLSAPKEKIDVDAARLIANHFCVKWTLFEIPDTNDLLKDFDEIVQIIDHNNGYIAKGKDNEYRKRIYLMENLNADVEVKSWVSETIRAYWYKHYGRTTMPKLSAKLFRNLYKIFIFNRPLAWKIDKIFEEYIADFEYKKIPSQYMPADMHYNEVTWGSWGGMNVSEMKLYSDITFIYNNRKFLDLMFRVPLNMRIADQHHLDMKKLLNRELYDMGIHVTNMKETRFRAFALNIIFAINMKLPF